MLAYMDNLHKAWPRWAILLPSRLYRLHSSWGSSPCTACDGSRKGNTLWDRPKHGPGNCLIWILAAHLMSSAVTFLFRSIRATNVLAWVQVSIMPFACNVLWPSMVIWLWSTLSAMNSTWYWPNVPGSNRLSSDPCVIATVFYWMTVPHHMNMRIPGNVSNH